MVEEAGLQAGAGKNGFLSVRENGRETNGETGNLSVRKEGVRQII